MSWKSLVCAGLLCALVAMPAMAAPSLSAALVTSGGFPVLGPNGGLQWTITVTPDGAWAAAGNGSVAAEVGFTLTHLGLQAVTTNTAQWDHEDAGVSPFVWAFTDGVETNLNEIMAALGSINFPNGTPSTMVTIETAEPVYVNAGNYLLTSDLDVLGAYGGNGRLAQNSINSDTATGSYTHSIIPGDANLNGGAGFDDYDLWKAAPPAGDRWDVADFNNNHGVGFDDYDIWKFTPGTTLPPLGAGAGAIMAAVPEPSSLVLALILGLAVAAGRRGRLL